MSAGRLVPEASKSEVEEHFSHRLPDMVAAISRLVEVESPSHDISALNRCADALGSYVTASLGRSPTVLRSGSERRPHLRLDLGSRTDVLLIGHFDTVHPVGSIANNPVRLEDGRLYGPGTLDMKGGVVSMVEITRRLQMFDPEPNITLFFNSDEEIGSAGSAPLLQEVAARARVVLVFDFGDPSRAFRNGARGVSHIEVRVTGKGGHAAYPERNRNPIEGLAKIVLAAIELQNKATGLSVTPTRVIGSDRTNVVADSATVVFDVRGQSAKQLQSVEHFLKTMDLSEAGLDVDAEVTVAITPFPITAENQGVWAAQQAADLLGWEEPQFTEARGASDANTVASVNESVLDGMGGWGDGAHSSRREYIDVESLEYFATYGAVISDLVLKGQVKRPHPPLHPA